MILAVTIRVPRSMKVIRTSDTDGEIFYVRTNARDRSVRLQSSRGAEGSLRRNRPLLVDTFHYLALFAIGATTVWSAATAFLGMMHRGRAELADILLLSISLEIGPMVGINFKTTKLPIRYLIDIAITALGRVLKELVGESIARGWISSWFRERFLCCPLLFGPEIRIKQVPSHESATDLKNGKRPQRGMSASGT